MSDSRENLSQTQAELYSAENISQQSQTQLESTLDHLRSVQAQLDHARELNHHLTAEHEEAQSAMDDLAQASSELQNVLTESQSELTSRRV